MAMKNLERWKFRADKILNNIESGSTEHFDDNDGIPENKDAITENEKSNFIAGNEEDRLETVSLTEVVEEIIINNPCEKIQDVDTISWEEEESIKSVISESVALWKEGDEVAWIDEEGLVVKSNALKGVVKNLSENEVCSTEL